LSASEKLTFWTIGHSAAELDELFRLLAAQGIQVLVDVRSSPYSQHAPQANRELLEAVATATDGWAPDPERRATAKALRPFSPLRNDLRSSPVDGITPAWTTNAC